MSPAVLWFMCATALAEKFCVQMVDEASCRAWVVELAVNAPAADHYCIPQVPAVKGDRQPVGGAR